MRPPTTPDRVDLKRNLKLVSPEEALRALLANITIKPPSGETVPVEESIGRILAEDVKSLLDVPLYTMTYMDGYAVRSEDTLKATSGNPASLTVVDKLFPADFPTSTRILAHQTAYVACGGPVPEGADAVIKVEETMLAEGSIKVSRPVRVGENTAPAGSEVRRGASTLRRGHTLRPQDIALLVGLGRRKVEVARKPRLALISVGDEIREFKSPDRMRKIPNNYALLVSGLAIEAGAAPLLLGVASDNMASITGKIAKGLREADIIATIGGCSVGVKDLVPDAITALGSPGVVTHGVAIRPGHVAGAGVIRGKPVVMMPGHIVSTLVAFYLFAAPLISRYLGLDGRNMLPTIRARLGQDIRANPYHEFLRVSLRVDNGEVIADSIHGGSNVLMTLVGSNGFTILPPNSEFKKGDWLEFTLFNRYEHAHFKS